MNSNPKKEILILFLCLLVGFVLRFYTFDQKSLWMDEIYTFQDSRDGFKDQLRFYKDNPSYLHPPLFSLLTHSFYPFTKPERDLRIIPLVLGTLSIPMIYLLARLFSPPIALPCTISLTFMTYHISLSQDGRSYSLLMFIAMIGLFWFMKHLTTSKKRYLILASLFFSLLFYTSYSSILFIALSQILWFYRPTQGDEKQVLSSSLIFNGLILLLCLPWIIFIISNYHGQPFTLDLRMTKHIVSFWNSAYGIIHDWAPYAPLTIISVILLVLFPFLSNDRKNAIVLIIILILPIGGLNLFCKLLKLSHFITSRYFIGFLPIFLISIYLALHTIENRFEAVKSILRLKYLFIILFVVSNFIILPLYYHSEKQDFRRLANYLKGEIQDGDIIILSSLAHFPGLLHYLGVYPHGRYYSIPHQTVSEDDIEYKVSLISENKKFIISYSKRYWLQYTLEKKRLWFVVNRITAKKEKDNPSCALKGYFDGSFLNINKFPTDDSMYLLFWPKSPEEKGIDMLIE